MTPQEEREIRERLQAMKQFVRERDVARGVMLYVKHVTILLDEVERLRGGT